jgi:hypothetical protein
MHTLSLGKYGLSALLLAIAVACSSDRITRSGPRSPSAPNYASTSGGPALVVNVSRDTTAQNETPIAVNPLDLDNLITGNNDWNFNNGCGVNASSDGGKTWTTTLPNGFIPGITKYTDDPSVPGTGAYDFGGDPAVAFGPDGTAYFACFGYQATQPFGVVLLLSRSTDGGRTWLTGGPKQPLTLVTAFQGNGKARGSTGQFPDHDAIHVAKDGTIYLAWAQFTGKSSHSPVYVATSTDGGHSFGLPVAVTSGSVRSDQDQRVVTDARGIAYLTFDNSIQGGKGTAMFVSTSANQGRSWSSPILLGTFQNPVCVFPPYCFNISGGQFRGPGSYPVPAVDPTHNRLYVAYTDIIGSRAQVLLTYASLNDLTHWTTPQIVAPGAGDRINVEMSIEPRSGRIDMMSNDRSWSGNTLFDVTYFESADGGQSWSVQRVTKSSWDPSQYGVPDGEGIRPFIGDYDGIVSLPTSVGMTWTGPGKTYGALPTNLEVYFGRVTP